MEQAALFVHVNDSIRELASHGPPTQTWEFICECSEFGCHALVSLTVTEFDERRSASPAVPVFAVEHVL